MNLALSTGLILSVVLNIILAKALIESNRGFSEWDKNKNSFIKDGAKLMEEFEKFCAKHGKTFQKGAK